MKKEDLTVYIVKIFPKTPQPTPLEEWVVVIKEHIIHTGNIFSSVEDFIQGLIQGLEIANYRVDTKVFTVYDDEEYQKTHRGDFSLDRLQELIEN